MEMEIEVNGNVNSVEFKWKCKKLASKEGVEGFTHGLKPKEARVVVSGERAQLNSFVRKLGRLKEVSGVEIAGVNNYDTAPGFYVAD